MQRTPYEPFVMSVTPFKEDFSLDEAALRAHFKRMVEARTGLVVAAPGVGEGWLLTPKETGRIVAIAVEEAKGKVPIWMTARDSSSSAIAYEQIKEAIANGVECVRIYPCAYGIGMTLSEREQERYWTELLDEIGVPVSIATIHSTYKTPLALVQRLVAKYPQINSVFISGDPSEVLEWRQGLPAKIRIFSSILNASLGASATIGAANNVLPKTFRQICDAWNEGDFETFARLQLLYDRFQKTWDLYKGGRNTARIPKAVLKIAGLQNGIPRPPILPPTDEEQSAVAAAKDRIGIPEWDALRKAAAVPA